MSRKQLATTVGAGALVLLILVLGASVGWTDLWDWLPDTEPFRSLLGWLVEPTRGAAL